jgi:hypothetical protein
LPIVQIVLKVGMILCEREIWSNFFLCESRIGAI